MPLTSPRIAVIGTGALGGLYGGRLVRSGHSVHFLVRSDFDHVSRHGLRVDSIDGDFVVPDIHAYERAEDMPRCDLALVCLKATANDSLHSLLPQILEPGGIVVLLQNGLGEEERVAPIDGVGTVISALGFVCATKVGPGHIRHQDYGSIRLAEYQRDRKPAGITPRLKSVSQLFERSGVTVGVAEDWLDARWKKLVWNVPFNGLSVILRADTGELLGHPPTRQLVRALMREVSRAAAAEGRPIDNDFIERMITDTARMRPYLPSMRVDFDAGRPLETSVMYRAPMLRAAESGVGMPHTATLATQLEFLAAARDRATVEQGG